LDESLNRQIQTNGELRQENAHLNEVINELRQGMTTLNHEKDEYLQKIEKGKSIRLEEIEKYQDHDQLTEKINDLKEDLHKQVTANTMIEEENTKLVTRIDELLKNTDALEVEKSSRISECQNLENELNILKEKQHDYWSVFDHSNFFPCQDICMEFHYPRLLVCDHWLMCFEPTCLLARKF
jgi:predicted nuclease with TOPRIM domain